jgi:GLPGLI family protein
MKNILLIFISCFIFFQIHAQISEAHYLVKQPVQISVGNNKTKEIILEYEGLIYQSGAKAITYLAPQYLMQYPSGEIKIPLESGFTTMLLNMDSMQLVHLYDKDSLRLWSFNGSNGTVRQSFTKKFRYGKLKCKILPETKIINGLQCQHAKMFFASDTTRIIHDIWFHPDISLSFGLVGLIDAPGLIVECSTPLTNISYSLKYFKTAEPIDNAIFWPAIFNKAKFEEMSPAAKPVNDAKKSAIMNEQ